MVSSLATTSFIGGKGPATTIVVLEDETDATTGTGATIGGGASELELEDVNEGIWAPAALLSRTRCNTV